MWSGRKLFEAIYYENYEGLALSRCPVVLGVVLEEVLVRGGTAS